MVPPVSLGGLEMKIAAAALTLMALVSSADAQAWRNCIQNSIGPGGWSRLAPEGVNQLVRGVGPQSARVVACRSVRAVASLLGQEGVYRSDPEADSRRTEIGAEGSTRGNWAEMAASFSLALPIGEGALEKSAYVSTG